MSRTKGILLIVLSSVSFGLIPLFSKIAYADGFDPFTLTLFRYAFASLGLYSIIKTKKMDITVDKKQYFNLFLVGFLGHCVMMLLLVTSYNYIATGLATTLHFVYPVAVMLGSMVIFREKVHWISVAALVASITGIFFLLGFGSFKDLSFTGVLFAFVSGVLYAYYILAIAKSSLRKVNSFVIAFYISLYNTLLMLAITTATGNLNFNFTHEGLISAIMLALFCSVFGMVAFQTGLKIISATTAAILSTFEPITSLIVGILLLAEILGWYHIAGSFLVIASVVMVASSERKSAGRMENLASTRLRGY